MRRMLPYLRCALAASLALFAGVQSSAAEPGWAPHRPLTLVVTFPPGGGTDWLARRLGSELQTRLGVPVLIDNRPGASGNIGARLVAQAPADGHTLLVVNSSFAINPGVMRQLDFDPRRDFSAVINLASVPSVLVVPADSPWLNLAQALAAGRPEAPLAFASCGNGTPQHLAGEMLARARQVPMLQIPYKGCGPALVAVAGAQVGLGVVTASSAAPLIAAGRLRALAVTSAQRSALLPQVPTVAEQGGAGYAVEQWHGLLAPAGTPPARLAELHRLLREILFTPQVSADLQAQGFTLDAGPAAGFAQLLLADIDRYARLTREMGLEVD